MGGEGKRGEALHPCAERGHPSLRQGSCPRHRHTHTGKEREWGGGRTEPLSGDLGGGRAPWGPGLGGDLHGPGSECAAVMTKSFLPVCPGLHNQLGLPAVLHSSAEGRGQKAHTVGTVGHTGALSHIPSFSGLLCVLLATI